MTGVIPYVVARVSWFAASSRARGIRFGTAASLAGVHIIAAASMTKVATPVQASTSFGSSRITAAAGIEADMTNRTTSATTIVYRRSNRSANTPATGPSTSAGSSRTAITGPKPPPLGGGGGKWGGGRGGGGGGANQTPGGEKHRTPHSHR